MKRTNVKFEDMMFEIYIKEISEIMKRFFNQQVFNKVQLDHIKKNFLQMIYSEKNYLSFQIENGKVSHLILATPSNKIGEKTLDATIFYFSKSSTPFNINNELQKILKSNICNNRKLFIGIPVHNKYLLEKFYSIGLNPWSYNLIGNIKKSLSTLKNCTLPKDLKLFKPRLKDISTIVNNEFVSHNKDKTSCINTNDKNVLLSEKKAFKSLYRGWIKEDRVIGVKKGEQIIGAISIMGQGKNAHIGTIWVSPKYQGKGLSKILYKEALNYMQNNGFKNFTGHTSTYKVLEFSKKLGRKVITYNYKL